MEVSSGFLGNLLGFIGIVCLDLYWVLIANVSIVFVCMFWGVLCNVCTGVCL